MVVIDSLTAKENGKDVIYTDSLSGISTPGKLVGWEKAHVIVKMISPIDNKMHATRCRPEDVELGKI